MINVKIFLPVNVVIIINIIEDNIAFKAVKVASTSVAVQLPPILV